MPTKICKSPRKPHDMNTDLRLMSLARRKTECPKALQEGKETLKGLLAQLSTVKNG